MLYDTDQVMIVITMMKECIRPQLLILMISSMLIDWTHGFYLSLHESNIKIFRKNLKIHQTNYHDLGHHSKKSKLCLWNDDRNAINFIFSQVKQNRLNRRSILNFPFTLMNNKNENDIMMKGEEYEVLNEQQTQIDEFDSLDVMLDNARNRFSYSLLITRIQSVFGVPIGFTPLNFLKRSDLILIALALSPMIDAKGFAIGLIIGKATQNTILSKCPRGVVQANIIQFWPVTIAILLDNLIM